jgi:hypothetical protein
MSGKAPKRLKGRKALAGSKPAVAVAVSQENVQPDTRRKPPPLTQLAPNELKTPEYDSPYFAGYPGRNAVAKAGTPTLKRGSSVGDVEPGGALVSPACPLPTLGSPPRQKGQEGDKPASPKVSSLMFKAQAAGTEPSGGEPAKPSGQPTPPVSPV